MSMRSSTVVIMALCGACLLSNMGAYAGEKSPNLGTPITEDQVASIVIWPDGRGLPDGVGTVAQGENLYQVHCLACHGTNGQNGINDTLVGGHVDANAVPLVRTIGSYWPYATSLFDYVRRSMPYNAPGSLQDHEVYSLVAYLLYLNGLTEKDASLDAQKLQAVELPNKFRFYTEYLLP